MAHKIRIAAVADIHYMTNSNGKLKNFFQKVSSVADILILAGDLTDTGHPDEAKVLVDDANEFVTVPIIGVLGNHDYEHGRTDEILRIFNDGGLKILDGEGIEIMGIGFAGVKGFGGGFGKYALRPWGESGIKNFVAESLLEAERLHFALENLSTRIKIAVLHYSPIKDTLVGESPEIFPFLGSSLLEEVINNDRVSVVFHGHAHAGTVYGQTSNGTAVHNVSMALLESTAQDAEIYKLIEVSF